MNIEFDQWFKKNYHTGLELSSRFVTMYMALHLLLEKKSRVIVETGTLRREGNWCDGLSTLIFGSFCQRYHGNLFTIDIDNHSINTCKRLTDEYRSSINYVVSDSVAFLRNFSLKIDLLYLDSMDCAKHGDSTSPQLIASQKHQLAEIENAFNKLSDDPVILLDDNNLVNGGKTQLSKNFLAEKGFKEVVSWKQSLWVKE